MSYDIELRSLPCSHCGRKGEEPELPTPTYNLTPIFDRALTGEPLPNAGVSEGAVVLLGAQTDRPRGLRLLTGRQARDTFEWIEKALGHLCDPARREEFVALEPPNKWGTLDNAVAVMERLLRAAKDYPDNVWDVR